MPQDTEVIQGAEIRLYESVTSLGIAWSRSLRLRLPHRELMGQLKEAGWQFDRKEDGRVVIESNSGDHFRFSRKHNVIVIKGPFRPEVPGESTRLIVFSP